MLRVAAVLLLLEAPALAQDADELKRARAQFQQATELEQAGNWAAALQRFREVGQVRMTPQVRFHIAVCEENLGRLVTALGGYELALAEAAPLPRTMTSFGIRARSRPIDCSTSPRKSGPTASASASASS